ncbi:MAG: assimilatory nitrite reductase small subunit [Candidatus Poribacteria bacterium]|nr:MAG: assimilatory nitrite reductase small subunit [Candidatus Poribacteria bacterium]
MAEREYMADLLKWQAEPEKEVCLGDLETIPLGEGRVFLVGTQAVAVFRTRKGELFALDNYCPHQGGPLGDGLVAAGKVACPLHGWLVDLKTGACPHSAQRVRTYPIREENGRLYLTFPVALAHGPEPF